MIKIIDVLQAGNNTVLVLDSQLPTKPWNKFKVGKKEYKPIPVYDMPNCVATDVHDDFVGKEIIFI